MMNEKYHYAEPFNRFQSWLKEAENQEINDPNAMALATVSVTGMPSVRMVLLKGHNASLIEGKGGFAFYTNKNSAKARDIDTSNKAALLFHWKSLRRQIRIQGHIIEANMQMTDDYFATRGRTSQIGAWASDQSSLLPSRTIFEKRFEEMKKKHKDQDIPRPPHWGGYILIPNHFEFWQDRPHRLHERQIFRLLKTYNDEMVTPPEWESHLLYP